MVVHYILRQKILKILMIVLCLNWLVTSLKLLYVMKGVVFRQRIRKEFLIPILVLSRREMVLAWLQYAVLL